MPLGTNALGFVEGYAASRVGAPRHGQPWDRTEEDNLLSRFALGDSLQQLAEAHQRTVGGIRARLNALLGITYPDTPEAYRRRGEPILRRRERRAVPRETNAPQFAQVERMRFIESPSPVEGDWVDTFRYSAPGPAAEAPVGALRDWPTPRTSALSSGRVHRLTRTRPARQRTSDGPTPVQEVPDHLTAKLPLSADQLAALAATINGLRPAQQGRVSAAQHSVLNRLAYQLAAKFEGEDNRSFDRAKWLEGCGVTKEN